MSPFKQMVVPPPMCAYHLKLPKPVNQVAFAPPQEGNKLAVLLSDNRVAIYETQTGWSNDQKKKFWPFLVLPSIVTALRFRRYDYAAQKQKGTIYNL